MPMWTDYGGRLDEIVAKTVFRPNRAHEAYACWLAGYCLAGKSPTHWYDYDAETRDIFTAAMNGTVIYPAHGAKSRRYIVLPGDSVHVIAAHSHNEVYDLANYTAVRQHRTAAHSYAIVPVYSDVIDYIAARRLLPDTLRVERLTRPMQREVARSRESVMRCGMVPDE